MKHLVEVVEEKPKHVEFFVGNTTKNISVKAIPSSVMRIELGDIKSPVTKKNLLILAQTYNVDWVNVYRYPVQNRFGYIIYGLMGNKGYPITYLRKELNSRQSGATQIWFEHDYVLPLKL